jgi:biotin operon repressor
MRHRHGVPVIDLSGTRWHSIAALARSIGCTPAALRHHIEPWQDGYRLVSAPHSSNIGRATWANRGNALPLAVLVLQLADATRRRDTGHVAELQHNLTLRVGDSAATAIVHALAAEQVPL